MFYDVIFWQNLEIELRISNQIILVFQEIFAHVGRNFQLDANSI